MDTLYIVLVGVLFLLAISDLIVGVSNDAVNFLNSAVGARAATFRIIMVVAALGVLVGATFSSGMMEVARKGIFNPQYFYFSEIIIIFLAVMITDVILLDVFNTYGMPTSTTVSIVFELLGAALAISTVKIYTDPEALNLFQYINSAKALAIISGILISVVVAFTFGGIIQYLSRLLFSFDYEKRLKYFGALWGGMAITAITYFMLIKGASGASFMTEATQNYIANHSGMILLASFLGWSILLQVITMVTRFNILRFIVLVGTFALAMAFAGNDLVNFIGVPLAGYNAYELYIQSGQSSTEMLMGGLAGKVPTPTFLLLLAGVIMVITLWTSKKAQSVVKTSLDLGRQDAGYERFPSSFLSRSIVRNFSAFAHRLNALVPENWKSFVERQFDQHPFAVKQESLGDEAPAFDMVRASVTLIVASILIAIGTALKLPLSTTYVTFMVFMGTSLADGAWGRESAVYRVTGVLSVIGGWFFTAISASSIAFVVAIAFYFGGNVAIGIMLVVAAILIYRTHKLHSKRMKEQLEFERKVDDGALTKSKALELSTKNLTILLGEFETILGATLKGLAAEDLNSLNATVRDFEKVFRQVETLKFQAGRDMARITDEDLEAGLSYVLVIDYLQEMAQSIRTIVEKSQKHIGNNHKPLLPVQMDELNEVLTRLKAQFQALQEVYRTLDEEKREKASEFLSPVLKAIRTGRKNQIKRIKAHEIGTRNSVLYLSHLGEFRNLAIFVSRMIAVLEDFVIKRVDTLSTPMVNPPWIEKPKSPE